MLMRKTPKKVWIAVAGVALAGLLMTGTFLYKDYKNKVNHEHYFSIIRKSIQISNTKKSASSRPALEIFSR